MSPVAKRVVAALLVVAGVVWALVNGPVEGPTLVTLSASHGVTLADLASVVAFALAGVLLLSSRRR